MRGTELPMAMSPRKPLHRMHYPPGEMCPLMLAVPRGEGDVTLSSQGTAV